MRPTPRVLRALVLFAACACSGACSMFLHGQAGPVVGTSGSVGGSIEGSWGLGAHDGEGDRSYTSLGYDLSVRAKFTSGVHSVALGAGLFGIYHPGRVFFLARGGFHPLQIDVVQGTPYANALSPYLSLGLGIPLRNRDGTSDVALTLSLGAEYAVRFYSLPREGFFGLTLGVAGFGGPVLRLPVGG